ncbi:MAG: hypothetical protein R3346_00075 [Candidatus Spechtbacterales bacterium]|nr:hypothetical protein [Candidatus Spechtbacterales bacterium]
MEVDISGLDKAAVLAVLYNAARPNGKGLYRYAPRPITIEEAREIIEEQGDDLRLDFGPLGEEYYEEYSFDYVRGRVLRVDITFDDFAPYGYNRHNGEQMAQRAINYLRKTGEVVCQDIIDYQSKLVLKDMMRAMDDAEYLGAGRVFRFYIFGREIDVSLVYNKENLKKHIQRILAELPE